MNKKMLVYNGRNLREIVNYVNEYNENNDNPITKDDIVEVLSHREQVFLIYFK